MTGMYGAPIAPMWIDDFFDQTERRLNEADTRERGFGRRAWSTNVTILLPAPTLVDNGVISWRRLNDGRIELRGRLKLNAPLANGTPVLRLPGVCAPPGDGGPHRSWLSALAPCATSGSNPGMVRVDIERKIVVQKLPDGKGGQVDKSVIYADLIARPPESRPLTDWIAFDHLSYDPNLYIDVLEPVVVTNHARVYSRGFEYMPDVWILSDDPDEQVAAEFGIAYLGYKNGLPITITPGVRANG